MTLKADFTNSLRSIWHTFVRQLLPIAPHNKQKSSRWSLLTTVACPEKELLRWNSVEFADSTSIQEFIMNYVVLEFSVETEDLNYLLTQKLLRYYLQNHQKMFSYFLLNI